MKRTSRWLRIRSDRRQGGQCDRCRSLLPRGAWCWRQLDDDDKQPGHYCHDCAVALLLAPARQAEVRVIALGGVA